MNTSKKGYTTRQYAYAKKRLGATQEFKKDTALAVGYSPSVAKNIALTIEKTKGFHNAMYALAGETGNMTMRIYHELAKKDLSQESVTTLLNAITVLAGAWETFTPKQKEESKPNALRAIILREQKVKTAKTVKPATK